MDQDFISGSDGVASQLQAFVVPAPSQKTRRNGAPTVLLMPTRSKSGPPANCPTSQSPTDGFPSLRNSYDAQITASPVQVETRLFAKKLVRVLRLWRVRLWRFRGLWLLRLGLSVVCGIWIVRQSAAVLQVPPYINFPRCNNESI
jgi:hypothetical protein